MKFNFRLQKVLEHRKRLEEAAQRDFMEAKSKTIEAMRILSEMYRAIDVAREDAQVMVTSGSAPNALNTIDTFVIGQKIRIENHRKKIRELKADEERLQDALIEAAKERKTLEKLKENKRLEFVEELERRERLEYDDLAVMRHGRGEGPFR